jgi:hypothetical protein
VCLQVILSICNMSTKPDCKNTENMHTCSMKILYIDVQNTHKRTLDQWRMIDWGKLYHYLQYKYQFDVIYYAVWYVSRYQSLYDQISSLWYTMLFKDTIVLPNNEVKGNVDIDIAIRSIFELTWWKTSTAYLMTNDWDYNTLVKTFIEHWVWWTLISPDANTLSKLLTRLSKDIVDLQRVKHLIQKSPD